MQPFSGGWEGAGSSGTTQESPNHGDTVHPQVHEIQLRYRISSPTLKTLLTIKQSPSRENVLKLACFATEFQSYTIKSHKKAFLRHINDHKPIPYPLRESISLPWHKVFLLVQLDLSHSPWPHLTVASRRALYQEIGAIYAALGKVLRCLVDILGLRLDGRGVNVALDVLRSVGAGVWEGSPNELLQVDNIGIKSLEKLSNAGIKNIKSLAKLDFCHIERLLSRNPPFGHHMTYQLSLFPVLSLSVDTVETQSFQSQRGGGQTSPSVARVSLVCENSKDPEWRKNRPWATLVIEGSNGRLVWFWRGKVKKLLGGKVMCLSLDIEKGEELQVTLACEEIVGTLVRKTLKL